MAGGSGSSTSGCRWTAPALLLVPHSEGDRHRGSVRLKSGCTVEDGAVNFSLKLILRHWFTGEEPRTSRLEKSILGYWFLNTCHDKGIIGVLSQGFMTSPLPLDSLCLPMSSARACTIDMALLYLLLLVPDFKSQTERRGDKWWPICTPATQFCNHFRFPEQSIPCS